MEFESQICLGDCKGKRREEEEEDEIMCGACGHFLKSNQQFCGRCGIKMKSENMWDKRLCNSTNNSESISKVRTMIGLWLRVTIEDGRIFVGRFLSFDKEKSIIMSECREYRRVKVAEGSG